MARARGHAGKAEPVQQLANAALVQGDAEPARNPRLDVHAAPAHDAVHLDIGSRPHPVCDLRLLFGRKPGQCAAAMPVAQACNAVRV